MNPKFTQFVDEAVEALPARIKKAIGNVAIVVEPFPRSKMPGEIEINRGSILLGLYQGIPQNVWGRNESGVPPDKITIFQNTIEMLAGNNEEKLKELVKDVVWHEIGHHFGFDEEQIRKIEQKRKN
ncbi:metallopeptidase family protein [Candidatus Peregrinibacteria bacterium]|nr:metallopeptidase family protein [Candidatus Peregrinibacteria bacterium]